jgi:hypothetical protein
MTLDAGVARLTSRRVRRHFRPRQMWDGYDREEAERFSPESTDGVRAQERGAQVKSENLQVPVG